MLIDAELYRLTVFLPPVLALGPVIAGIIWVRRHADWFGRLNALRQIAVIVTLVGWMVLIAIVFGNQQRWLDKADVWIIREGKTGIMKENKTLIGVTDYRFANGKTVTLHAADAHYQIIINDSTRAIRRTNLLYGPCASKSVHTLRATLSLGFNLEIPPGSVNTEAEFGYFGDSQDKPPEEITVTQLSGDRDTPCEQRYWYRPVTPKSTER